MERTITSYAIALLSPEKKCNESSCKRPPWEFRKVVATRAAHLRGCALVTYRVQ